MVFLTLALLISNGDLLLLAAYDMRVDGDWLEGSDFDPTIAVPCDGQYGAGADPQLDRAIAVLLPG
jgi:carboxyl-terminal processing protease